MHPCGRATCGLLTLGDMQHLSRLRGLLAALCLFALGPTVHAQPADFDRCLASLRAELPRHPRVSADSFARFTREAQDLRPPIDTATRSQPEFQLAVWEYLARLVDDKRIRDGQALLQRESALLDALAPRYPVDRTTLVAILGVESDFGRLQGRFPVVDATLSRACLNLASRDRQSQFFTALWLLQEGLVDAERFRGSWAGAFGMTQFMPATFARYRADGDGDGRVDIAGSLADALATAANYLSNLGWTAGLPWGLEVKAPSDVARLWNSSEREHACLAEPEARPSGRCRSLAQWAALGVQAVDGRPLGLSFPAWPALDRHTTMALLTPAGADGPAWLVTRNFQAIWYYNRADAYALAIGLLSSALRDEPGIQAAWPGPEAGLALSRTGITALQTLLVQAGQCNLAVDGFDGPATRQAIRDEERRRGWLETGRPTTVLLERLRADPPAEALRCAEPAAAPALRPDPTPDPVPAAAAASGPT
jgi:glucose-6-phosphate 1-epimerase